ncbi:MAG TPA: hypothetical protein VMM79_14345 [Longimicrobiales bacterium]|nr:hypothetical protein [Longimicrobiales bacterium]
MIPNLFRRAKPEPAIGPSPVVEPDAAESDPLARIEAEVEAATVALEYVLARSAVANAAMFKARDRAEASGSSEDRDRFLAAKEEFFGDVCKAESRARVRLTSLRLARDQMRYGSRGVQGAAFREGADGAV